MERLVAGDLSIDLEEIDGRLRLDWHGRSNDRQPRLKLAPFFTEVLARAEPGRLLVEMRFDRLEHFNSSTISSVIDFIHDAKKRGIPVVIGYDARVTWQRIAFEALRVFTTGDGLLELRPAT